MNGLQDIKCIYLDCQVSMFQVCKALQWLNLLMDIHGQVDMNYIKLILKVSMFHFNKVVYWVHSLDNKIQVDKFYKFQG